MAPFLRIREVTLGDNSTAAMEQFLLPDAGDDAYRVTEAIFRKYATPNWPVERLRVYVDMLKAFGFNSIQLYDQWESYIDAGWGLDGLLWPPDAERPGRADPRDWPAKVDAIADHARSIGMRTALFVWGNTGFDFRANRFHWKLCPNDKADREILERYWDHQARHAPRFDHIVTHWGDPGGCNRNGCSIETPQRLHNEIVARFRRGNPRIESTFSLWMLADERFGVWPGYKGPQSIFDAGILPDDVMLAVHGEPGKFDFEQVRAIYRAGRRAGVWGWYIADNEIFPSLHPRAKASKDYFSALPADAHDLIAWHSIDSNNHTLNMQNLFATGRIMQDPSSDPDALMREFIIGALGKNNLDHATTVFRAIESLRPMWPHRYGVKGLIDPILAREALAAARAIEIADDFAPAFPMVLTPRELADELIAQCECIVGFMEFSEAAADLRKRKEKGLDPSALKSAIASLPALAAPLDYLTNLEYARYRAILAELAAEKKTLPGA